MRIAMAVAVAMAMAMLVSCGGKKDGNSDKAPPPTKSAPTFDANVPVKVDPVASAAHLKAGRALGADKKWAEAAAEFERAVAADRTSARAWSELGWAAFLAGDLPRATTANETAVKVATDDKLKAASLYNLGRIAEQQRAFEQARAHYAKSVALRPNATVQRRLDSLTPGKADVAPALVCAAAMSRADLCKCLVQEISLDPTDMDLDEWSEQDAGAADEPADTPSDAQCDPVGGTTGLAIWRVTHGGDTEAMHGYWVVAGAGNQVHAIATLRNDIGLMRRAYNEFELDSVKKLSAGDRKYVQIVAKTLEFEQSFGEDITWTAREVTICPLPTKPGVGCPLQIEQTARVEWSTMDDSPEALAELKKEHGDSLAREHTLELAIAADGTATVRLVSGTYDEHERDVTGTYKLW